jgi:hypothetical protein
MAHTYNPNTQEVETRKLRPALDIEIVKEVGWAMVYRGDLAQKKKSYMTQKIPFLVIYPEN